MKRLAPLIIGAICVAVFCFGLVRLFQLRFEAGDVYPAYSSLRADPLGAMALYESLGRVPHLEVRRDFTGENKLPDSPRTTYLHLAGDPYDWQWMPAELVREIEAFTTRGGRLVVTLQPVNSKWNFFNTTAVPVPPPITFTNVAGTNATALTNAIITTKRPPRRILKGEIEQAVDVEARWGFNFLHQPLVLDEHGVVQPQKVFRRGTKLPLPESLEWHSGMVLCNLDNAWKQVYLRGTNTVMAEKEFGSGTLVIATDSFFISNEAMQSDRHADLLVWLVGPAATVVFDESHFGIVESSGVMALARKYRLHGAMVGMLLLAALFIWKNTTSFVPLSVAATRKEFIEGKDSASGFVNLLRRNIAAKDILDVCFNEWTKSLRRRSDYTITGVEAAQAAMQEELARSERRREPVAAYQRISRALKRSKFRVPSSAPDAVDPGDSSRMKQ